MPALCKPFAYSALLILKAQVVRSRLQFRFSLIGFLTDQLIEPKEPQMEQKVALVTGGASGIGEEVCRLLAASIPGCRLRH